MSIRQRQRIELSRSWQPRLTLGRGVAQTVNCLFPSNSSRRVSSVTFPSLNTYFLKIKLFTSKISEKCKKNRLKNKNHKLVTNKILRNNRLSNRHYRYLFRTPLKLDQMEKNLRDRKQAVKLGSITRQKKKRKLNQIAKLMYKRTLVDQNIS